MLALNVAQSTAAATAAIIADAQSSWLGVAQSRPEHDSTLARWLDDTKQSKHAVAAAQPGQFAIQLGNNVAEDLHAPSTGRREPIQSRANAIARRGSALERENDIAATPDSGGNTRANGQ